jgi:hypothetical protein
MPPRQEGNTTALLTLPYLHAGTLGCRSSPAGGAEAQSGDEKTTKQNRPPPLLPRGVCEPSQSKNGQAVRSRGSRCCGMLLCSTRGVAAPGCRGGL